MDDAVSSYIGRFPSRIRAILSKVRAAIKSAAPKAEETLSYGMAGYKYNGKRLVYFAAWKKHVGFYGATPAAIKALKKELTGYALLKGTIQFKFDEPVPYGLIGKLVRYRVKEIMAKI